MELLEDMEMLGLEERSLESHGILWQHVEEALRFSLIIGKLPPKVVGATCEAVRPQGQDAPKK